MTNKEFAKQIRLEAVKMVHRANASHIGGALSIADVLAVLYGGVLKNLDPSNPTNHERDYLIFSKGHCCVSLYAALAIKGFMPMESLETYGQEGSILMSHVSYKVPGVELSTGSLGHGLPVSCGIALGLKARKMQNRVFCIVGDGEMDEGSNWEAMLFAAQQSLSNLCLIIDVNKMQALGNSKDIMDLEDLPQKFKAFNWNVVRIDGNDIEAVEEALNNFDNTQGKPYAIVCDTVKGKGVSYMEHNLRFHYAPPRDSEFNQAVLEITNS